MYCLSRIGDWRFKERGRNNNNEFPIYKSYIKERWIEFPYSNNSDLNIYCVILLVEKH